MQISSRPAVPADAEGWVACHLDALADTYPTMPAEFVESRRRRFDELVAEVAVEIAGATGPEAHRVAVTGAGDVVGIAHRRWGPAAWEARVGADPWDLPQLTTLYLAAAARGRGVGGRLIDLLMGGDPGYLWVMDANPRAASFYSRRGFVAEDRSWSSGPSWFHQPMRRMVRT